MNSNILQGCVPALKTPCQSARTPNYPALVKKGQALLTAGMNGVEYCGSMGDWPLLTDEQRREGVRRLAEAGVPVIVGTGAQNPARAAAHAQRVGAKGLMDSSPHVARNFSGGSVSALRWHSWSGTRTARRDLQQPLLRVRDQSGPVLRSAARVSKSRRLQRFWRCGFLELRRRAHHSCRHQRQILHGSCRRIQPARQRLCLQEAQHRAEKAQLLQIASRLLLNSERLEYSEKSLMSNECPTIG